MTQHDYDALRCRECQAIAKLEKAYPARRNWLIDDIDFYARYAEYSPALVRIAAVEDGVIKNSNSWQDAVDYLFRKLEVAHG